MYPLRAAVLTKGRCCSAAATARRALSSELDSRLPADLDRCAGGLPGRGGGSDHDQRDSLSCQRALRELLWYRDGGRRPCPRAPGIYLPGILELNPDGLDAVGGGQHVVEVGAQGAAVGVQHADRQPWVGAGSLKAKPKNRVKRTGISTRKRADLRSRVTCVRSFMARSSTRIGHLLSESAAEEQGAGCEEHEPGSDQHHGRQQHIRRARRRPAPAASRAWPTPAAAPASASRSSGAWLGSPVGIRPPSMPGEGHDQPDYGTGLADGAHERHQQDAEP